MKIKKFSFIKILLLIIFCLFSKISYNAYAMENTTTEETSFSSNKLSTSSSEENSIATSSEILKETGENNSKYYATVDDNQNNAIGTPPDAKKPSRDGKTFGLAIIRHGFNSQPEEEQYGIYEDTENPIIFNDMRILTSRTQLLKTVDVYRWHWDLNTKKWIKDKLNRSEDSINAVGILGVLNVRDYIPVLPIGEYYYQFSFHEGPLILGDTYYSKLVKVSVVEKRIPTEAIELTDDFPDIIYPDVDYDVSAKIVPYNSTDKIIWNPNDNDNDLLNFKPQIGRKTTLRAGNGRIDEINQQYISDSFYSEKVNKNPNVMGIPAKLKISAGTLPPKTKDILVGGLPAYNNPEDSGGGWQVGGLKELKNTLGDFDSLKDLSYSWKFTNSKDEDINIDSFDNLGVHNTSGKIKNNDLDQLNDEQLLTFDKDSSFVKQARIATEGNSSYRAQLRINATVTEDGQTSNITIISNKGEMQITNPLGKLVLNTVPKFDFGQVEAASIYTGTKLSKNTLSPTNNLKITDTRVSPGWRLSAKMSSMRNKNNVIHNANIHINGLPENKNAILIDDNEERNILTSQVSGEWSIEGILTFGENPQIILNEGDRFEGNIIWNLTSNQPIIDELN